MLIAFLLSVAAFLLMSLACANYAASAKRWKDLAEDATREKQLRTHVDELAQTKHEPSEQIYVTEYPTDGEL